MTTSQTDVQEKEHYHHYHARQGNGNNQNQIPTSRANQYHDKILVGAESCPNSEYQVLYDTQARMLNVTWPDGIMRVCMDHAVTTENATASIAQEKANIGRLTHLT